MIIEVALNLASQILFFIVVVYLIPWLISNFINKNGDLKKMAEKYDKCEDEEKKKRLEKQIKIYRHFLEPIRAIQSWTSDIWRNLAEYIVLLVTFNHPDLVTRVGKGKREEDLGNTYLAKGQLYCGNYEHDHPKFYWYNPIKMIGVYLCDLVHVLLRPAIAVVLFYFMLPSTTSSIIFGFAQWGFANGNIGNIEFLTSIYNGFIDIV